MLPIAAPPLEQLKAIRPGPVHQSAHVFTKCPTNEERRDDFEAASIALADSDGRIADLLSLRSTLATDLARSGVSVQVAQRLMRHRNVNLTLRVYTSLRILDLAQGLAKLIDA